MSNTSMAVQGDKTAKKAGEADIEEVGVPPVNLHRVGRKIDRHVGRMQEVVG